MPKKTNKKIIKEGDNFSILIPKNVDKKVLEYLNSDDKKTRNQKILDALHYYVTQKNFFEIFIETIKSELSKEIKNSIEEYLQINKNEAKKEENTEKIVNSFLKKKFRQIKNL